MPRGTYEGWIESFDYRQSNQGNAMLDGTLKFMYDDGSEDPETGQPVGEKERTVHWFLVLQGDQAGRSREALAALDPELDMEKFRPEDMDEHFRDVAVLIRLKLSPDRDNPKGPKRNNVVSVELAPEEA